MISINLAQGRGILIFEGRKKHMRTQGYVAILERGDVLTPQAAFDRFRDDRETHKDITPATHDTYISRFRLFAAFLREGGVTDIRAVTIDMLEKYFSRLRNRTDLRAKNGNGVQLSPRSVHSHFISLRALFRFLYLEEVHRRKLVPQGGRWRNRRPEAIAEAEDRA